MPSAFMSLLGATRGNITKFKLLKKACDKESGRKGFIPMEFFLEVLLSKQSDLGLKLRSCELRRHSLDQLLQRQKGIALVSDGNGHVVGVSCEHQVLVDPDPATTFPIDLQGCTRRRLANVLEINEDARLNIMYVTLVPDMTISLQDR
jgi:hypothetical protein